MISDPVHAAVGPVGHGLVTYGVVFSLMIWFIAIGAVIVLGAVAGATWNQRKRRPRGARA